MRWLQALSVEVRGRGTSGRREKALALALVCLVCVYAATSGVSFNTPAKGEKSAPDIAALERRIGILKRYQASSSEIDRAYAEIAIPYAERLAHLTFLNPGQPSEDRTLVLQSLAAFFSEIGAEQPSSIVLNAVGEPSGAVRRYAVELAFDAISDQSALLAVWLVSSPTRGIYWDGFSIVADRTNKSVTLSGRLAATVASIVE